MFLNRTKKFIYLRTPKTGSTSIQAYLVDNVDKSDDVAYESAPLFSMAAHNISTPECHLNINEMLLYNIITENEILDYNIFGVLRNPIDRFISAVYHGRNEPNCVLDMNYIVKKALRHGDFDCITKIPQQYWLTYNETPINNIYLYEDIPLMMNAMLNTETNLIYKYRENRYEQNRIGTLSDGLCKEIISLYKPDYEMYLSYVDKRNSRLDK